MKARPRHKGMQEVRKEAPAGVGFGVMRMKLTRFQVSGFRSLRDVDLSPSNLSVFLDAEGTATRDFAALLLLLRELAEGRLQRHLRESGVLAGPRAPGPVRVEMVSFPGDIYGVELRPQSDGSWRVAWELLDVHLGVSALLVDPDTDAPREESALPTLAQEDPGPPTTPPADSPYDGETWMVGHVVSTVMWSVRQTLRGFQVQPAMETPETASLLFLEEPSEDLPPNALWEYSRRARDAALQSQVMFFTRCESLVEEFDPRDVIHADTRDGASRFTRR